MTLLARRDELEAAAAAAEQRLLAARSGLGAAEKALAELERAGSAARARLSAARDPLVVLGAPALDDAHLLTAWTTLENWAASAASARSEGIGSEQEKVNAARSVVDDLTGLVMGRAGRRRPGPGSGLGSGQRVP